MKSKKKSLTAKIIFAALLVVLLAIEVIYRVSPFDKELYMLLSRFVGGGACLLFMIEFSFTRILSPIGNKKPLLWLLTIPGFIIAINNFPFVSFFAGDCQVKSDAGSLLFYALICLGTGFFEEMAFRGCIFSFVLQRRGNKVVDVFWSIVISSAIFGGVHIVNMFMGADPGATLLQIGYSFLIGGMCSIMLVKTHNIWLCVILHAVYNFAGGVVPNCGDGIIWTLPEIILTAVVAVGVAIYVIYTLLKIQPHEVDGVFKKDIGE